ncbi:MAG TPA: BrnT family toxin [Phycisphaerales bacterium]|nr:BrnT family toxin [Phycisphaerales bacterium]
MDTDRRLFVVFTVRANRIRVISARTMSRKERRIYETP